MFAQLQIRNGLELRKRFAKPLRGSPLEREHLRVCQHEREVVDVREHCVFRQHAMLAKAPLGQG